MLYFIIGLPGRFTQWCERATLALARRTDGQIAPLHAQNGEALALGLMRAQGAGQVVVLQQPGGKLRTALLESGRRFILSLDDPRNAVAELVLDATAPLADAVRAVASSCAAIPGHAGAPGALVLHADGAGRDAAAAASAIAAHFGLPAPSADMVAAARQMTEEQDDSAAPGGHWWSSLAPGDRAMADGALAGYLGTDGRPAALTWTPGLFSCGDAPVDITGRARCLFNGPGILLPEGTWRMSVPLTFSRDTLEHDFTLDIVAGTRLAGQTIRPDRAGEQTFVFDLAIDRTVEHPVTVSLSLKRAAFDGSVTLGPVTLTPLP